MTHDFNGEYGHGTHLVCAAALRDSLDYAKDPSAFPESAERYGTWTVEKTYIHLYPENVIYLDIDSPLEKFGGLTAFQVTQNGFRHHVSRRYCGQGGQYLFGCRSIGQQEQAGSGCMQSF